MSRAAILQLAQGKTQVQMTHHVVVKPLFVMIRDFLTEQVPVVSHYLAKRIQALCTAWYGMGQGSEM